MNAAAATGTRSGTNAAAGRLGRRLVLGVILISSLVTGAITAFELFRQYRMDVDEIANQFSAIDRSMVPALAEAVWVEDQVQIRTIMNGLANVRDVEEVSVVAEGLKSWHAGNRVSSRALVHTVPLRRVYKGSDVSIGKLEITASIDKVYDRLWNTLFVVLASNAAKTLTVAIFMLYLFQRLIGRHLEHIAGHVIGIGSDRAESIALARAPDGGLWRPDVLDQIVASLNEANQTVATQRLELERRVVERTAQLEAAMIHAEAADRIKSAFLATMSHELRTPLNSIIGFTGIMLQKLPGPLNAEQEKQLGFVRNASHHLLAMINDVLDISKVEAGELRLARERFDLRALLERLGTAFAQEAARRSLAFNLDIGENESIVTGDARRVEQVLNNLLSNALKFTPRGSISLSCTRKGDSFAIAVTDTGVGIKSDDMDKLFRPFSQIETALPELREGTGLGLAISTHLAQAMGGKITAESEWGKGSRFTFSLPAGGNT